MLKDYICKVVYLHSCHVQFVLKSLIYTMTAVTQPHTVILAGTYRPPAVSAMKK